MKRIFMIFAATAAIVSCGKVEEMIQPQAHEVTITAEHLKTVIDNTGAVTWDGNEEISVLFKKGNEEFHVETYENANGAGHTAKFVGTIKSHVKFANGWNDAAYCVCPSKSVDDNTGKVMHSLPAEQYAHASHPGSFETGLNLSYAPLSLKKIEESSQGQTMFQNALSVLRLTPGSGDITSITINASGPLVGEAPMVFDAEGNLVIDQKGNWGECGNSVVLKPAGGTGCFNKGVTYNILVYPGAHTSFSVTLNYKEYGDYTKTLKTAPTFLPAKYYTLGFTSDSELIITQMNKDVEILESRLPSLDELEGNVEGLLNQIQSISLMSEYLDNAVYARYAQMTYSKQKLDLSLDYIVKPVAAAEALVEAFKQNPKVVSGLLGYDKGDGFELVSNPLTVKALSLDDVQGIGIMTATVDASNIDNKFYEGTWDASIALQISNGKSDMISDFANLVPTAGNSISGTNLISVVPGASVVIPFNYSVSGADYTLEVTKSQGVASTACSYDKNSKTGNLTVSFMDETVVDPSVTLTLTVGKGESQEVVEYDYTFFDNGVRIVLLTSGDVDWIGGDVTIEDKSNITGGTLVQIGGTGVAFDNIATFTFDENSGPQRTATVRFSVMTNSMTYYKDITLLQRAYNTPLIKTYYYNSQKVELQKAEAKGCSNYFNIVILGDGYKKKDLAVEGKFEKSARSAMETFFAIEPYKTYMNRFNVYMVAYESDEEGTDIRSSGVNKNTYFNSYCQGGGNTAAYVSDGGEDKVIAAVKNAVGKEDAKYYRSIAILLINTAEGAGSTGYPFRGYKANWPNGYASFAIAVLAANSDRTNGLIKHEAGGHAFGRLADEYYTGGTVTSDKVTELQDWHDKGFYWNVTDSSTGYYKFAWPGYPDVGFFEGAWNYAHGLYRPTERGMMQNNNGVFNAPSRHAIYHRIITESGDLYVPMYFPEYDKINLNN